MPGWQSLEETFRDQGFSIVAVAMDRAEAARPWIEAAKPSYPCLIDRQHYLADVYNLVNVPQSVWIDETGRIVRTPGAAGGSDAFRAIDRMTGAMPEAALAERERTKEQFLDAVRDWIRNGAASRHVMTPGQAGARLQRPNPAIAEANTLFRLAQYLLEQGSGADTVGANDREEEALGYWRRATELHPQSWTMWRQNAAKNARGLASSPEFWARVDALGAQSYYLPFD